MKLQGEHTFDAPRSEVWEALLDPQILVNTLPGCESLEEVGENEFKGALNIQVGPVSGKFDGLVKLLELEPEEGYRLKLDGKGAPGFVKGAGKIRLADAEGGGTVLSYEIDAQVGGRIAGVGQRLLTSSGRVISRQALEGLEAQLEARGGSAEADAEPEPAESPESSGALETPEPSEPKKPSPAASTSADGAGAGQESPRKVHRPTTQAPSQTKFAAEFARGLFEEMVPEKARPVVILLALLGWFLLGFFLGRWTG